MSHTEVMLSGSGGQGMILAGIILARAAIKDGHEVTQTQSYGPESRGGASRAEVIISDQPIDFPKVSAADVVLAMTQEACDRYASRVRPGGLLVVDPDLVQQVPAVDGVVKRVPITSLARAATGREISANIVALGVINGCAGLVSGKALAEAVAESVPKDSRAGNVKALAAGLAAVASAP